MFHVGILMVLAFGYKAISSKLAEGSKSAVSGALLAAMNTGHDGSMTTIHANTPRDSLSRLENMIGMAGLNLPHQAARQQIASAITVIVQALRLTDGKRKITSIQEITGMEGEIIITQDLFRFAYDTSDFSDKVKGTFDSSHIRPGFIERARYYGLEAALMDVMQS